MSFDYRKLPDSFFKQYLDPDAFNVGRLHHTERAGTGQYDHFYEKGIYYCVCCGGDHPLYSSETKFNSGTGWPSFWAPFNDNSITLSPDLSGFMARVEVSCQRCGSHLGHLFEDGPSEYTGQRYCLNSCVLRFIPEGEKLIRTFSVPKSFL